MCPCEFLSHEPGRIRCRRAFVWGFDYNFTNYNFKQKLESFKNTYLVRYLFKIQVL